LLKEIGDIKAKGYK